jgi:hypothetical protein
MAFVRLNRDRRRQFTGWLIDPVKHFALLVNNQEELYCSPKLEARLRELEALRDQTWSSNGRSLEPYLKLAPKVVEGKEYQDLFGIDHLARARVANDKLSLALPAVRNVALGHYTPTKPLQNLSEELSELLSRVEVHYASAAQASQATDEFFNSVDNCSFAELKPSAARECADVVLNAGHVSAQSTESRVIRKAVARFERRLEELQAGLNTYSAAATKHFNMLQNTVCPRSDLVKINVLNRIENSLALANTPEGLQRYLDEFDYILRIAGLERFLANIPSNEELYRLTDHLEATAMIDSAI